jgi:1,2-diacylglycerol 3-alpha-glucosyltransferase
VIKVFLVCSGLGNVKRGFESFTQECFDALSQEKSLEITLFKGGGKSSPKAIPLRNLPRDNWSTKQLTKLIGKDSYFIEQASFCLSLIPHIHQKKPDVIFFSDFALGTMLWHWRRLSKLPYKLLFSNGAPNGPPFSRMDHVQHLTPVHYHMALNAGEPPSKHSLVPYGINVSSYLDIPSKSERESLRRQLNLPTERPIILSVAAINKTHKRMDYLIREVANLPEPRPYLVLLGQQTTESPEIFQLSNQLLGLNNFQIRTVDYHEIANFYKVADAFVLASLNEGLPRVLLEAMSNGLPCLAHDYEITRFVLGEQGYLANLQLTGSLADLISKVLAEGNNESKRRLNHSSVYERFSWERLRPGYIEMIEKCTAAN